MLLKYFRYFSYFRDFHPLKSLVLQGVVKMFAVRYPPFCCPLPPLLLSATPLFAVRYPPFSGLFSFKALCLVWVFARPKNMNTGCRKCFVVLHTQIMFGQRGTVLPAIFPRKKRRKGVHVAFKRFYNTAPESAVGVFDLCILREIGAGG